MQWTELPDLKAEISATPVDSQTYDTYLTNSGQSRAHNPTLRQQPLVNVSATEAMTFATWLTGQEGRPYRLPTFNELLWLAQQNTRMHIWPCHPELRLPGNMPSCPYEWLQCSPDFTGEHARLHCAAHPAWLIAAPKPVIRAAFADVRFPYITFRLVRERIRSDA